MVGMRSAEIVVVVPSPFSFNRRISNACRSANAVHIRLFTATMSITACSNTVEVWSLRTARGFFKVS